MSMCTRSETLGGSECKLTNLLREPTHLVRRLFLEPLDVVIGTGVAYIAMPLLQLAVEDALKIRGISPLPVVDVNTVFDQVLRGVQCRSE